jgi:hypothetical protein
MNTISDGSATRFVNRTHRRFPVRYFVAYSDGSLQLKGVVRNMSGGGWMITGETPGEVGTRIQLKIKGSVSEPPIRIQSARVQWKRDGVFGIKVERVDPVGLLSLQERIHTLACR